MATINAAVHNPFPFRDNTGALVSGKVDSDWTKVLLKDGAASSVTVTVSAVTGKSGYYDASFTPDDDGTWTPFLSITHSGQMYYFAGDPIDVLPAAADPAALATAIADVKSTASAISANVDAPVTSRASAAVWTSARAAKVDLIGAGTAVALSPVSVDATTLTLNRGADYTGDDTIAFTEPAAGWESLSGASVTLAILNRVNTALLTVAGSVTSATPGSQAVAFALTDGQVASLPLGTGVAKFRIRAVLADQSERVLAGGSVTVRA